MANEVDTTLLDNLNSIKNSKADIKQALINKGQSPTNILADYAQLIENIQTGEDLNDVLNTQDQKIAELEEALENKTAGKAKLNIFIQEDEPTEKNGIWLQSNKTFDEVCVDTDIIADEEWDTIFPYKVLPYAFKSIRNQVCCVENDIYIFGGNNPYNHALKYNTKTNEYTALKNIPKDFSNGFIIYHEGFIYLFGGNVDPTTVYKYNIETNEYTQLSNMPFNSILTSAIKVENEVYMFGSSSQSSLNYVVYKYNIETNEYTQLSNSPQRFYNGICKLIGDYIYLLGGPSSAYCYKFNYKSNSYTRLSNAPFSINGSSSETFGNNIYIFGNGGYDATNYNKSYKYNSMLDTYEQLKSIPFSVGSSGCAIVNEKIYIFGGEYNATKLQVMNLNLKDYEDNSILISQGVGDYNTQLINAGTSGKLNYYFHDVWHYTREDGLDKTIPTYYGNGTEWVKFKN